jgi:hypothetical protein
VSYTAAVAGQRCHSSGEYHRHHLCSTKVPRCCDATRLDFPHSSRLRRGSRASTQPTRSATPSRPSNSATPTARVDDVEESVTEAQWEVVENYTDAEEGESTWTLKGRDQGGIDKAKTTITEAIEKAQAATHVGFLTLPDRSSFPRIVGAKGSNIARLHDMTGAHILVGRENSTIIITGTFSHSSISRLKNRIVPGSASSLEAAKEAILKTVHGPPRQRRGY